MYVLSKKKRNNTQDGWLLQHPSKIAKDSNIEEIVDIDFVTEGEDIIKVYSRVYDKNNPVLCL